MSWKRYKIKDSERGHRKPLSTEEPTKIYTIAVTMSLHDALRKLNPSIIRDTLIKLVRGKDGR